MKNDQVINKILSLFGDVEYKFGGSNYFGTSVV